MPIRKAQQTGAHQQPYSEQTETPKPAILSAQFLQVLRLDHKRRTDRRQCDAGGVKLRFR
jgi:hypothetical protein